MGVSCIVTNPHKEEIMELTHSIEMQRVQDGIFLRFVVRGPEGATEFSLFAPKLTAWDFSVHSRSPRSSPWSRFEHCNILGEPCHYEGSTLRAEDVFAQFAESGEGAVWDALERYYHNALTEEEHNDPDGAIPERGPANRE
jgi:hypothetical protein